MLALNNGEDLEILDHWHIDGGNVVWYRHSGKEFGRVSIKQAIII